MSTARPPAELLHSAASYRCPSGCNPDIELARQRPDGTGGVPVWHMTVLHDDGCPELSPRCVPNAIRLDAALTALSALTAEQVAALQATTPAQERDQAAAARREAIRIAEAMEGKPGGARVVPGTAIPDWIRLGLLDIYGRWAAGRATVCLHNPVLSRPEPVWATAWRPGVVTCSHCLGLFNQHGIADRTCDGCGHVCDGIDADDAIRVASVTFGPLTYRAGVCNSCFIDMGDMA